MAASAGCGPSAPAARDLEPNPHGERQIVEVDLRGSLEESEGEPFSRRSSLRQRLAMLEEVRRDADVIGLVVFIGDLETGLTKVEDLVAAFGSVRRSGRKVYCGIDTASNIEMLLAAGACDHVSVTPGGGVELTGVAADVVFLRSALGSLGVEADVVRAGAYKDAFEPLTRDEMSPQMRESLGALMDDTFAVLVDGVARGRRLPEATVRGLLDRGLFDPEGARAAGLVDSVRFPDALRYLARKELRGKIAKNWGRERRDAGADDVSKLVRSLAGEPSPPSPKEPHLAVVYVTGVITSGDDEAGLFADEAASARALTKALDRARRDAATKAVVLRIDSPGGSAPASDLIWRAVDRVRRNKPIVASMSDTAASGGYYVAAGATKIVAQPSTVTGSIGVISAKIVAKGLADRLGVHVESISRGAMADLGSPFRRWTPDERRALEGITSSVYSLFLRRVAAGRGPRIPTEARVREVAEGRVWTGRRALGLGLVDRLGGLEDAMALARRLGKLPASCPIEVLPQPTGLLQRLVGGDPAARAWIGSLPVPLPLRRAAATVELLEREQMLAVMPFSLHFR